MKKILIVNNNMNIGGVQKALANLLAEISGKYDITLFLFAETGGLMQDIPEEVKVVAANLLLRVLGITHAEAKRAGIFPLLWRGVMVVLTRLFKTRFVFNLLSRTEHIDQEYDIGISYLQNGTETCFYGGCAEFVLNSVKAKKKICFVHCDFENYEGRCAYNANTLMRFDKAAAVSYSVEKRLLKAVPQLKGKTMTVHNCYNAKQIIKLSRAYDAPKTSGRINIFSASRLRREKGILRMISIFSKIKDENVDFVWRIAGDGEDRREIENQICRYGLQDKVILLGNLSNPYPYFRSADVLLVPSYDEAAPMVFGEARILGTPVFTTETASAREMIEETNAGKVIDNEDHKIF